MTGAPRQMRWWGWGEPAEEVKITTAGEALMLARLGMSGWADRPPVSLERVSLPQPALSASALRSMRAAVGDANVLTDRETRIRRAAGRSYADLIRLRAGDAGTAPDAVVVPGSEDEIGSILAICESEGVAVIPFGGGTSVVGGVTPGRGGLGAAVTLDLARFDSLEVDRRSLLATAGAGLRARNVEAALQAQGLTLGHFPQSFEYASIGGYVATRSAGQASTGYGRIDELVVALQMVAPAGRIRTPRVPASAAGPSVRELLVGSEGAFGVITAATLAVRPSPEVRAFEGWSFRNFAAGVEALRDVEQSEASPDVARLSDEEETAIGLAMADRGSLTDRAARTYLRARGHDRGCLVIVGFEGEREEVAPRKARCTRILRRHGGLALGRRAGEAWVRTRYLAPYLRDVLLDRGVLAETLETATTWSRLEALHAAVGQALGSSLAEEGSRPLVACHVSHLYPSGASLYFTCMARARQGAEVEQWRAAKEAASRAIVEHGATITHHHAVGRDHAAFLRHEIGDLGIAALQAAKGRFDPHGIMNPGALLGPEG